MAEKFFSMDKFFTPCPNCGKDMVAARVGGRDSVGILSIWICDCNQDALAQGDYANDILSAVSKVRGGNQQCKGIALGSIA